MSTIDPRQLFDESELKFTFIRSDGPGGQNVNKVASAVQLRFDVAASPSLSNEVKARLLKLGGKKVTQDGILVIEAKRYRTQESNRADALERFYKLVQKALEEPKKRKKTRPTKASQEKRLQRKKQRGVIKKLRGKTSIQED